MDRITIFINEKVGRSALYNYLFILFELIYGFFLRDILLEHSTGAVYGARETPLLGVAVMIAVVVGTYAVFQKCRERRAAGNTPAAAAEFILGVFNWVLVIFMVFTAVQSLGIDISRPTDEMSDLENGLIIASILCAMINAVAVIAFIVRLSEPYVKPISRVKKISADISAFFFLCVSYTVVWETIMYRSVSKNGSYDIMTAEGIFNLTGGAVAFIMLYPPMRLPFLIEELNDIRNGRAGLKLYISYAAVIIAGIIPMIKKPFI